MTVKTHRLIGLVAGGGYFLATASSNYQPATLGAVIVASYLGSLIPDADDAGADIFEIFDTNGDGGWIPEAMIPEWGRQYIYAPYDRYGV